VKHSSRTSRAANPAGARERVRNSEACQRTAFPDHLRVPHKAALTGLRLGNPRAPKAPATAVRERSGDTTARPTVTGQAFAG